MVLFLLFLLMPAPADAAVRPADFAHARGLETALEGAVYRVTLPRSVYEGLTPRRNTLAVFNAKGELVPFTVRRSEPEYRVTELPECRVPFYELPGARDGDETEGAENLDVYVETGEGGQVVSVKSGRGGSWRSRRYLLDFSAIAAESGDVTRRRLRLSQPDENTFIFVNASASESENLRDWSPLQKTTLMRLDNGDERLDGDGLDLPRAPKRYVLLRIEGLERSSELKGVGYFAAARSVLRREETAEIEGMAVRGGPAPAAEYDMRGALPVSSVNLVLREPGFYQVSLFSRPDAQREWIPRGRAELSMIRNRDGSVRSNAPLTLGLVEDRYWRVEFDGAFGGEPPRMEMTWRPEDVLFLAQGGGPYLLAFGGSRELPLPQNDGFLQGASVMEASLDTTTGTDTAPEEAAAPGGGAGWQRYVVWALLILSGLLLSGMAWRLMKGGR